MSDFYDCYFGQRYLGIEAIDRARAAFEAGQQSKQKEMDRLKSIIAEALAVYDRPMCDETALYQRDDDIRQILTEDKFI